MFSLQNNTVFVDPKQMPQLYRDCFLVKPNMKEYTEWFGTFDYTIAREKLKEYGWTWLVVTDGAEGVHVIDDKEQWHIKEDVREVADVTGAGDTFAGGFVGYLSKCNEINWENMKSAIIVGSAMASFTVEKFGIDRLVEVEEDEINARIKAFKELTSFQI